MWSWITNPNPDPPKGTHPWSLRLIILKYRTQFSLFSILQYFIVGRLDNWHTESKYCVGTSSRLPYDYMDLFCVPFLKEPPFHPNRSATYGFTSNWFSVYGKKPKITRLCVVPYRSNSPPPSLTPAPPIMYYILPLNLYAFVHELPCPCYLGFQCITIPPWQY